MTQSIILNKFSPIRDDVYCLIFAGSFFFDPTNDNWKDIDITIVTKKQSLDLQGEISRIAIGLKNDPGLDMSIDCISKEIALNPQNILQLHTKVANAIYEANLNPSRIIYWDINNEIYKLSPDDVQLYSKTALRELFQEAHKEISRNLYSMIYNSDPKIIKKYIKRLFNIIKMAIIFKTQEIPQSKNDTLKKAQRLFSYDFDNINNLKEVINVWPNLDNYNYTTLLYDIFKEIYDFYRYLIQNENIL